MNKLFRTLVLLSLSLVVITAASCKKRATSVADEELPEATQTESSADNSQADEMQTHVYTVVHTEVSNVEEQSFKTGGSQLPSDKCASIYISWDSTMLNSIKHKYVDTMIIDYGQVAGCTWGGRTKKGRVIITKKCKMSDVGCKITAVLDSFYVDDYRVKGTATLENQGYTIAELTLHTILNDGKIISPDNKFASFTTDRYYKISPGNNRTIINVFGTSDGVNHLGETYSATVTPEQALMFIDDCKYPHKGIVTITSPGSPAVEVDFSGGTGACDNLAVVKINGTKYKQTLKPSFGWY
jgi:hypothetical protein